MDGPFAIYVAHSGFQPGLDERIHDSLLGSGRTSVVLESAPYGNLEYVRLRSQEEGPALRGISQGDAGAYKKMCASLVQEIKDTHSPDHQRRGSVFQLALVRGIYKTGVTVKFETDLYLDQAEVDRVSFHHQAAKGHAQREMISLFLGKKQEALDALMHNEEEERHYIEARDDVLKGRLTPDDAVIIGYQHKVATDCIDHSVPLPKLLPYQTLLSDIIADNILCNTGLHQPAHLILHGIAAQFTQADFDVVMDYLDNEMRGCSILQDPRPSALGVHELPIFCLIGPQGEGWRSDDLKVEIGNQLIQRCDARGYLKPEILEQGKDLKPVFRRHLKV